MLREVKGYNEYGTIFEHYFEDVDGQMHGMYKRSLHENNFFLYECPFKNGFNYGIAKLGSGYNYYRFVSFKNTIINGVYIEFNY